MKRILNILMLIMMMLPAFDAAAQDGRQLVVNVDDASKIELKIGKSPDFTSSYNRLINLTEGENVINYTADDKYVIVAHTGLWTPIYKVTFNGRELTMDYDYTYGAILPAEGATMDIIVAEPEAEMLTFTANIDDPSRIKYFTRYPENEDKTMEAGSNTYTFRDGDYFKVICREVAKVCTLDGEAVEPQTLNGSVVYTFTPQAGSQFDIRFKDSDDPHSGQGTFTLNIDDISLLRFFTQEGTDYKEMLDQLVEGENTIEFALGTEFSLWPVSGSVPREITLDGEEIALRGSAYYFAPSDGSVVNCMFHAPYNPDGCMVKVSFVDPETESFVQFAQIDDVDIDLSELLAGKRVDYGSEIWLSYRRFDYVIHNITVNGTSLGPNYLGAVCFNVYEDTEIVFDVEKPVKVNVTVNVDNANHVVAFTSRYYNPNATNDNVDLKTGTNELTLTNMTPELRFKATEGYMITSVTDGDGVEYAADEEFVYTVTIAEGMVITVKTQQIEYDKTFVMYVEGDDDFEYEMVSSPAYRNILLEPGFNAVSFNAELEPNFLFAFEGTPYVYVNGDALETADGSTYMIDSHDGDIVRVYLNGIPEFYTVNFDVSVDIANDIVVMRDLVQQVDINTQQTELQNTYYALTLLSEDVSIEVTLISNGENTKIYPEEGVYLMLIDSDAVVSVKKVGSGDGICNAANGTANGDVYNAQGMLVKRTATDSDIKALPAGIYICNGKKIIIK